MPTPDGEDPLAGNPEPAAGPVADSERPHGGHWIADRIRQAVALGQIVPGQRLLQRDLAERYGVSTTPVREAFQELAAQQFITIDANRGATVVLRSPAEIRELYEIRKTLETLSTVTAARRMTEADYQELEQLIEDLRVATTHKERADLNWRFHRRISEAAGMPYLLTLIENMRDQVSYYVNSLYRDSSDTQGAVRDHENILAACRQQDPERIRDAISEHLEQTAQIAITVASTRSNWQLRDR